MKLDLNIGDTILTGKFKNKPVVVKSIETDDKGQPTYNGGKKILNFRIKKLIPDNKKKDMDETIKKVGDGEWAVYPKSGGKRLGTHSSKEKALAQLSAIEASKARARKESTMDNHEQLRSMIRTQIKSVLDEGWLDTLKSKLKGPQEYTYRDLKKDFRKDLADLGRDAKKKYGWSDQEFVWAMINVVEDWRTGPVKFGS